MVSVAIVGLLLAPRSVRFGTVVSYGIAAPRAVRVGAAAVPYTVLLLGRCDSVQQCHGRVAPRVASVMYNSAPRSVRTPRMSDEQRHSAPSDGITPSQSLESVVPKYDDKFCDCFAIFACETGGAEPKPVPDEVAEQMDRVQGRYWKIGEVSGSAVYRQEVDGGSGVGSGAGGSGGGGIGGGGSGDGSSDGGLYIYKDEKDG